MKQFLPLIFLFIPYIRNLVLPFQRSIYPVLDDNNEFNSLYNNYIGVDICLGTPLQCLSLNLELNVYPLWVISSKSPNKTEIQKSFDSSHSQSYYLKSNFIIIFNYDKYEKGYLSFDSVTIDKDIKVDDIYFLLIEEFSEVPVNSGVLGLDLQNRVYQDTPGSNLISQLKKQDVLENYAFSIIYDDMDGNSLSNYQKGKLIIGQYPHDIIPSLKGKQPVYEKVLQTGTTLKWGFEFDSLMIDNEIIEEKIKGGFSIEIGVNLGSVLYHEKVYKDFFISQLNDKNCVKKKFKKIFFGYICNNLINLNRIKPLEFTIGNHKFSLGKEDLFIKLPNNKLLFNIIFPGKDYANVTFDWILGAPFLKKYPLIFDMDKKIIGFYKEGTASIASKGGNGTLWFIIIILLIIVIGGGGFCYYRRRRLVKLRRKNKMHLSLAIQ